MQVLAGLQRIQYVFVYPESNDLVLAGPAGDWRPGDEDIIITPSRGSRSCNSTTWWLFFAR